MWAFRAASNSVLHASSKIANKFSPFHDLSYDITKLYGLRSWQAPKWMKSLYCSNLDELNGKERSEAQWKWVCSEAISQRWNGLRNKIFLEYAARLFKHRDDNSKSFIHCNVTRVDLCGEIFLCVKLAFVRLKLVKKLALYTNANKYCERLLTLLLSL